MGGTLELFGCKARRGWQAPVTAHHLTSFCHVVLSAHPSFQHHHSTQMKKLLKKVKQKFKPAANQLVAGAGSTPALGPLAESPAATTHRLHDSISSPTAPIIGSSASVNPPLLVTPLPSSPAYGLVHQKSTTRPSITASTQTAVENLLAAQQCGSNLFASLRAALTGVVRVGELVEVRALLQTLRLSTLN